MRRGHVVDERDVAARREPGDTAAERVTEGAGTGSPDLGQRVLRFAPGRSQPRSPGSREQVLFVLAGRGTLDLDGAEHPLEPDTGALVAPGQAWAVDNPGPGDLALVAVDGPPAGVGRASVGAGATRRLADQEEEQATAQREFRVVFDPASGCTSMTQFVGWIPPGRAPEHFHTYDEVIYVLDGRGVLHMEGESRPIGGGSCIHLPPRLRHSLENTEEVPMRVLGVFRPAGSPAEAYLPDGRPAYRPATQEEEERS